MSEWLKRIAGRPGILPLAGELGQVYGYAATAILAAFLWKVADPSLVGLSWFAAGVVFFETGAWWPRPLLRNQAYVLFVLAFAALLTINLYEIYPASLGLRGADLLPRWAIVEISAVAYYYLFWRLRPAEHRFVQAAIEPAVADLSSIAGTVLLTILAWKELDPPLVAVAWAILALILFEVGNIARFGRLSQQGHVLAGLTFGRLFMANFVAPGETMGISHRVLTVVPIIALFYYLYSQTRNIAAFKLAGKQLQISRLYSWGSAVALLALARFELGRAYAVVGMAPLFVVFLILGRYLRDTDFRAQSYVLAILTFARCWATNAYLIGTAFGMPERVVTMVPAIAAFTLATAVSMQKMQVERITGENIVVRLLGFIDNNSHRFFALLGAALMAVLFYYELPIGWLTIAFATEGLILIVVGIAAEERSFRIDGLVLLLVALLKLVTIDISNVEPIYKILSYIGVGLILLAASLMYTRYRSVIEKYV
jgi:hypothetical protein